MGPAHKSNMQHKLCFEKLSVRPRTSMQQSQLEPHPAALHQLPNTTTTKYSPTSSSVLHRRSREAMTSWDRVGYLGRYRSAATSTASALRMPSPCTGEHSRAQRDGPGHSAALAVGWREWLAVHTHGTERQWAAQ